MHVGTTANICKVVYEDGGVVVKGKGDHIYVKLCKEMRNVFCPINRDESAGWLMSEQCESLRD